MTLTLTVLAGTVETTVLTTVLSAVTVLPISGSLALLSLESANAHQLPGSGKLTSLSCYVCRYVCRDVAADDGRHNSIRGRHSGAWLSLGDSGT